MILLTDEEIAGYFKETPNTLLVGKLIAKTQRDLTASIKEAEIKKLREKIHTTNVYYLRETNRLGEECRQKIEQTRQEMVEWILDNEQKPRMYDSAVVIDWGKMQALLKEIE